MEDKNKNQTQEDKLKPEDKLKIAHAPDKNAENPKEGNSSHYDEHVSDLYSKCEEYKNDLKRLAAEFDNYKKRVQNDSQLSRKLGREDVLLPILTLSDEFAQALEHTKSQQEKEGFTLLSKKLASLISAFGVEEVKCSGEPNPNEQEVMLQIPGEPAGQICQVLRKGYKIGGRLLRPAQVSVYSGEKNGNNDKTDSNDKKEKTTGTSGPPDPSVTGDGKDRNEN